MVDGGWDECKNYTDVISCPSGQDRYAKAKAEALVGNKTYTYYVKSCAFEKECKENVCSRMGGGGGLPKNFFRPFGPHFGLRAPSLDLPLFYRGNTSSAFDKKKRKIPHYLSPISSNCFLGDLELFSNWIIYFGKQNILPNQPPMLNCLLCPTGCFSSGTAFFRGGGEG